MEEAIEKQSHRERQAQWTESLAVGNEDFVRDTKEKLGIKAVGRDVIEVNGSCELGETATPYRADLAHENEYLRQENTFYWNMFL